VVSVRCNIGPATRSYLACFFMRSVDITHRVQATIPRIIIRFTQDSVSPDGRGVDVAIFPFTGLIAGAVRQLCEEGQLSISPGQMVEINTDGKIRLLERDKRG